MEPVEVVVAHHESATLRVGDVFLEVDGDRARADAEVAAMHLAPVPTPEVLWRRPPVLALAAMPGRALGRLGRPSDASPAAWAAVGAIPRRLHTAPVPDLPGRRPDPVAAAADLDRECVHREHLDDVLDGYGLAVDVDVIRAWWSLRSLSTVRWLVEHGFDADPTPADDVPGRPRSELAVLRAAD